MKWRSRFVLNKSLLPQLKTYCNFCLYCFFKLSIKHFLTLEVVARPGAPYGGGGDESSTSWNLRFTAKCRADRWLRRLREKGRRAILMQHLSGCSAKIIYIYIYFTHSGWRHKLRNVTRFVSNYERRCVVNERGLVMVERGGIGHILSEKKT